MVYDLKHRKTEQRATSMLFVYIITLDQGLHSKQLVSDVAILFLLWYQVRHLFLVAECQLVGARLPRQLPAHELDAVKALGRVLRLDVEVVGAGVEVLEDK